MNETRRENIANNFRNTELGYLRIKKNLKITHFKNSETESLLKKIILSTSLKDIQTKGKNHYFLCLSENAILTINSNTLTIITAKQSRKIKQKI